MVALKDPTHPVAEQLALYAEQARSLGSGIDTPSRLAEPIAFQSVLNFGLHLYEMLNAIDQWEHEFPDAGRDNDLAEMYRQWVEPGPLILREIGEQERRGQRVENATSFREAYLTIASPASVAPERIEKARESIRQGKTKSMEEMRAALENRILRRG